jgi:4'-phosphopantetheinyl transferase
MAAESLPEMPRSLKKGTIFLLWENIRELSVPVEALAPTLSEAEQERVARFRFEDDRLRSRVAWGLTRSALGRVLGTTPGAVEFTENDFGKPLLASGPSFSMAHSGNWVLIGVAADGRLGVDVEAPREITDMDDLAETVFSAEELAEFRSVPAAEKTRAFFRGWTRKEAFVKAIGGGLSIPLREFSVSLGPNVHQALRSIDLPSEREGTWRVLPLPDRPDAMSALAWDREVEEVRLVDPRSLRP